MSKKFPFNEVLEDAEESFMLFKLLIASVRSAQDTGKYADEIWKTALGKARLCSNRIARIERELELQHRRNEKARCKHRRGYESFTSGWSKCLDCGKRWRTKDAKKANQLLETMPS